MAKDYRREPPITTVEREVQRSRAAKFKHRPVFALTIECASEIDQQRLFKRFAKALPDRRIRIVVA